METTIDILNRKTSENPWTDEREKKLNDKGLFSLPSKSDHYRWVYKNGEITGRLLVVFCLENLL